MKIIVYAAVSLDGFIAREDDSTPWSDEEWEAFQEFVKSCDICLLGRRTYEIMKKDGFVEGPKYIVVTNDNSFDSGELQKMSIQTKEDLPAADRIGVLGGGELNGSLAKLGVIDEVILDVEPLTFGTGKSLFGGKKVELRLVPTKTVPYHDLQFRIVTWYRNESTRIRR